MRAGIGRLLNGVSQYDTLIRLSYRRAMECGLYEWIADEELEAALKALVGRYQAECLDGGDSHAALAEHIARLLTQVLRRQPARDRVNHQVDLCNRLVRVLSESDPGGISGTVT